MPHPVAAPALDGAVQLHPRFRYALGVDVQLPAERRQRFARTVDVSATGAFLACDVDLAPGAFFPMRFTLDRAPLVVLVRVVHRLDAARADALGRSPGVGVVFERMPAPTRAQLDGLLAQLERDAWLAYGAVPGLMPPPRQPLPLIV